MKRIIYIILALAAFSIMLSFSAVAAPEEVPSVIINMGENTADPLKVLALITIIAVLPSILILTTSFTRIIIVLSFVRNAIGLQQTPPNQVLVGLALLLSFFVMSPVINEINTQAYIPYTKGQIVQSKAIDNAVTPLKNFMLKQTKNDDLKLFVNLAKEPEVKSVNDIKIHVVIAAFITSELKRAFTIGFMIFLPFLIIDMVVASVLMSMGMMMLPPVMISLPFKLMLFVLVDGWGLIVKTLITSFN